MSPRALLLLPSFLLTSLSAPAKTVIFWEPGFPAVDTAAPPRSVLEDALGPLHPVFVSLADLQRADALAAGDLLILPYGSAFPVDAWNAIHQHLDRGDLLVIGGRPLAVPVWKDGSGWRLVPATNAYSRTIGIEHAYVAQDIKGRFLWDDTVALEPLQAEPRRVFVMATDSGRGGRRGIGYLVNEGGARIAAPVVAHDAFEDFSVPPTSRRVFLAFDAAPEFWTSADAARLLRGAASYASRGPMRLWIDLYSLTLAPGDRGSATLDVLRRGNSASSVTLELLRDGRVLASSQLPCSATLHREVTFDPPLTEPGLYAVRATLYQDGAAVERYTTGFWVRDSKLLHSGSKLEAGHDYFRLDGKPYLPVGANYFLSDPFDAGFFVGGPLGGNAWLWERDFAEMERHGLSMVRTGVWLNRGMYLDPISGAASERFLRALEAYLHSAARHHVQVIFTFSAFEPQTTLHAQSQDPIRSAPGRNPYTDPVTIRAEAAWIASIATRFKDVPTLSFDLINEPSFSNPRRLWHGNTPNNDPTELAAWHQWLATHFRSVTDLTAAWNVPATEFASFDAVPLPDPGDLDLARYGNPRLARAVDYNHFAQDAFTHWVAEMVRAIREAGATQPVTVGQDEGGVANRMLNHFYADAPIDYTTNHTWWRDDALLWNSVAAKRVDKPNLIGETGVQPAWSMDTTWRWDEVHALPLTERKFALGFAAGNAGVLHWAWESGDPFGTLRRDGSHKQWVDVLTGLARFARDAQPYATEVRLPEIALVLPQSLQLSVFGNWSVAAQQKSVRALYHYARASAYAVGEYQLHLLGSPKLIIVPAPWVLNQGAWEALLAKVKAGATLLISGRIDLDEHFHPVESRVRNVIPGYSLALLTTRENAIEWPGGSAVLTYSGDATTFAERGALKSGTFFEAPLGAGRILYFSFPLEFADNLDTLGRIYRYAIQRAGLKDDYVTTCQDPGILIAPTRLPNSTLYVLTSESAQAAACDFRDAKSGAEIPVKLPPGRAALLLIDSAGKIAARYDPN